jgi:hypothetical protein
LIWQIAPSHSALLTLSLATIAWFVGALATWELRRILKRLRITHAKPSLERAPIRQKR